MSVDRTRLYSTCDRFIEYMLYTLVFFIPTSKSVVEVFATLSIMIWLFKNGMMARDWALKKRGSSSTPKGRFGLFVILVPLTVIILLLVYSSIMISLTVISHHFNIGPDPFAATVFIPIALFAALLILVFIIIVFAVTSKDYGFSIKASILSFIVICLITSVFTTQRPVISAEAFLFKTMEYLLIFLIMADTINTPRRVFNLLFSFLAAAFFVGLDGIYQRFTGYDLFRKFPIFVNSRITGIFKSPNGFGIYLATVLPLPLGLIAFSVTTWKKNLGLLALSLILAACLLLTLTRGAWVGFLVGFLFLFIFAGGKRFVVALIVLVLLVSLVVAFAPSTIRGQLSSFMKLGSDVSSMDRLVMWKTAWKMFIDRPVFGHGLNTFMSVFEIYKPANYTQIVYAHNCFLQMAAETGLIGLFVFLWFCLSVIFRAVSKFFGTSDKLIKAATIGASACVLATLTSSFVETNLYSLPLAVLFWSLCGLAAARIQPE